MLHEIYFLFKDLLVDSNRSPLEANYIFMKFYMSLTL